MHLLALPFLLLSFTGFLLFRPQCAAAAVNATSVGKAPPGVPLIDEPVEGVNRSLRNLPLEVDDKVGGLLPRSSTGRALLSASPQGDTEALVFLDGTIFLFDSNSIRGSFSTGHPLSSSYLALTDGDDGYFLSCGDDWELYQHSRNFGKKKLEMTVEEYVNMTPIFSADGGITLGSTKSTGFFFYEKTGNVVSSQWMDGLHAPGELVAHDGKSLVPVLQSQGDLRYGPGESKSYYFVRKDYCISHYTNSSKLAWNLTVAHIEARTCMQADCTFFVKVPLRQVYGPNPFPLDSGRSTPQLPKPSQNMIHQSRNPSPTALRGSFNLVKSLGLENRQNFGDLLQSTVVMRPTYHQSNDGSSDIGGITVWHPSSHEVATKASPLWYQIPAVFVLASLLYAMLRSLFKSNKQSTLSMKKQDGVSKKRKSRKAGNTKSSSPTIKEDSQPQENAEGNNRPNFGDKERELLYNNTRTDKYENGRWIGRLFVSQTEIAKGSNGTVVLEGVYDGRLVAVKRLVRAHHDVASKEIQNLIASDQHPNIVRWFGVEHDLDFVYLALERCSCSLDDLIKYFSDFSVSNNLNSVFDDKVRVHLNNCGNEDLEFWKENGCPSPQMIKIMRDIVFGLAHLHELGIVHRDLKPQNVLISSERSLSAKLSDMGISKRLPDDMSSLGQHATGHGSSGWQAPEQLLHERQTRAVDIFSLGCVLFFCMTKGKHPFGNYFERDTNIVNNRFDLFLVEHVPEAVHLFSNLLERDPHLRPKAAEVLLHPLFWNSETRLSFLRDTSDRVELEDRDSGSDLLKELEKIASVAFGGKWGDKLDPLFISDMGRYRKYKFESTRDLLRVIRNKLNHFRELPKDLQEILSPVPDGFDYYFSRRFPKLFMEVYKVVYRFCKDDDFFKKYFHSSF